MFIGNLTVRQLEDKLSCSFSDEDYEFLSKHRTDDANFKANNKFHIYEVPFTIIMGYRIKNEMLKLLNRYDWEIKCKEPLALYVKDKE